MAGFFVKVEMVYSNGKPVDIEINFNLNDDYQAHVYNAAHGYRDVYNMEFFSDITVASNYGTIDLNRNELKIGMEFDCMQRLFALIELSNEQFLSEQRPSFLINSNINMYRLLNYNRDNNTYNSGKNDRRNVNVRRRLLTYFGTVPHNDVIDGVLGCNDSITNCTISCYDTYECFNCQICIDEVHSSSCYHVAGDVIDDDCADSNSNNVYHLREKQQTYIVNAQQEQQEKQKNKSKIIKTQLKKRKWSSK